MGAREQRKYKTRIMLQDILDKKDIPRAQMSLTDAIQKQSLVSDYIRIREPSPEQVEHKRQVDELLKTFKSALTNVTHEAIDSLEKGGTFDAVQKLLQKRMQPSEVASLQHSIEMQSSIHSPGPKEDGAFITQKTAEMEGEDDVNIDAVEEQQQVA